MIGPVLVTAVSLIAGALTGGLGGLAAGLLIAIGINVAVAAGAAIWASQIGSILELEDARANAPCPPGFSRLCDAIYSRALR